jgi:hypothetical protein
MSAVQDAIAEIEQSLDTLAPQHEGLRDYYRLNLLPPTMEIVKESIQLYDHRVAALETALAALKALDAAGHPDVIVREIPETEYQDLVNNKDTVDAALSTFAPSVPAADLGLASAEPERK